MSAASPASTDAGRTAPDHVLLAGATGIVGRRLLPRLVARGHRVTALTRDPERLPMLRAAGAVGAVVDVLDPEAVAATMSAAAPDVVVHQLTDLRDGDRTANAHLRTVGTRHLVDAAHAAGVSRVVAQSIAWAYTAGDGPAGEDTPLRADVPGVPELESAVRDLPEWVVLRYGTFYGPGTWYAPDGLFADRARARDLPADADVTSFVHIDDAATAALDALTWPNGAVNVADDDPAAASDWVPVFCEAVGAPAPEVDTSSPRRSWARGADNARARRLGWIPSHPSWREGFRLLHRSSCSPETDS